MLTTHFLVFFVTKSRRRRDYENRAIVILPLANESCVRASLSLFFAMSAFTAACRSALTGAPIKALANRRSVKVRCSTRCLMQLTTKRKKPSGKISFCFVTFYSVKPPTVARATLRSLPPLVDARAHGYIFSICYQRGCARPEGDVLRFARVRLNHRRRRRGTSRQPPDCSIGTHRPPSSPPSRQRLLNRVSHSPLSRPFPTTAMSAGSRRRQHHHPREVLLLPLRS